jgi:hypothetical protein
MIEPTATAAETPTSKANVLPARRVRIFFLLEVLLGIPVLMLVGMGSIQPDPVKLVKGISRI